MNMRVTADAGLRRIEGGRVVIGGSPLRLFRLTPAGSARLDAWLDGQPVADVDGEKRLVRRLLRAGVVHPVPDLAEGFGADQVTLVVPVCDRPERLARVLEDTAGAAGATVVVDDGSPDAAGIEAVAGRWNATVLRAPEPTGPAAARNRGWRVAPTEVVLFVDADCFHPRPGPDNRWLERLLAQLADPEVGIVAPRVIAPPLLDPPVFDHQSPAPNREQAGSDALRLYERDHSPLDQGDSPARVHPRGRVRYVPAAALLVRRSALESLGGFDEDMTVGEDVDLVWRADAAGITVRYEPSVTFAHEVRPDLRSWLVQRYRYGTSAAGLDRRHPGAVAPAALPWPIALAWLTAMAGHRRTAAMVMALNVIRARRLFDSLDPPPVGSRAEATRLAVQAHLGGGRLLADAVRRVWWPLVPLATRTRTGRRVAVAAMGPPIWDAVNAFGRRRSGRDRVALFGAFRWFGLRLADDLAYGAGAWAGALRVRRLGALLPRLTN